MPTYTSTREVRAVQISSIRWTEWNMDLSFNGKILSGPELGSVCGICLGFKLMEGFGIPEVGWWYLEFCDSEFECALLPPNTFEAIYCQKLEPKPE